MKPIFVQENLRVSTEYKNGTETVHHAYFKVQFTESGPFQVLIIKTTADYSKALTYSLKNDFDSYSPFNHQESICTENSWVHAVLSVVNQKPYSTFLYKELVLRGGDETYTYEFTKECQDKLSKSEDKNALSKVHFIANSAKTRVVNTNDNKEQAFESSLRLG